MKAFRFRLDPVVRYRRYLEQTALMDLAKAKQSLDRIQKKIETLKQELLWADKQLCSEEEQGIDVGRHRIYVAYLRGLNQRIAVESNRLVEQEAVVREKEKAVKAQRTKRRSLEQLREKAFGRYEKHVRAEEQKAADELVSLRWRVETR
ncbi:MAG: flagellar export protein FliJ [Deltaproteobacteria bacterium]|nr:flagellar export protein FliJ [Deltaproteobacteria bacterium]